MLAPDMPLSVQQTAQAKLGKGTITTRRVINNLYTRLTIIEYCLIE